MFPARLNATASGALSQFIVARRAVLDGRGSRWLNLSETG
jgi:hypothetical protein